MSEMTNGEALCLIQELVSNAAVIVSRDWPGVVDVDDVVQSINERLLRDDYAVRVYELGDDSQRKRMLIKIGGQIAQIERADYERFSGRYHYSTDEVRQTLENGALNGERGFFHDQTSDVLEAFEELDEDKQDLLIAKFVEGESPKDRKAVTRAVDQLTKIMNSKAKTAKAEHEGVGNRKILTNAAAVAITANHYRDFPYKEA